MNYTCIILCPLILVPSPDIISHIHSPKRAESIGLTLILIFDKHPNPRRTSDLPKHKIKNNEHTEYCRNGGTSNSLCCYIKDTPRNVTTRKERANVLNYYDTVLYWLTRLTLKHSDTTKAKKRLVFVSVGLVLITSTCLFAFTISTHTWINTTTLTQSDHNHMYHHT